MEWITLALSLGDKLLDKLPDYDQRKKDDYYKKKKQYLLERSKNYPQRDDDLLLTLKEDLYNYLDAFRKELEG